MAVYSKFSKVQPPPDRAIFHNLNPWKWDDGVWVDTTNGNVNITLPSSTEINISDTPSRFFESRVERQEDIKLTDIIFDDPSRLKKWMPCVKTGGFYSQKDRDLLFSTESTLTTFPTDLDSYGRSLSILSSVADTSSSIQIGYLTRDLYTHSITLSNEFNKVSKFKGISVNGRELDTEMPENIDTTVREFTISQEGQETLSIEILEDINLDIVDDIATLTLLQPPTYLHSPVFTRTDIFRNYIPFNEFVNKETNPGVFGELDEGDYTVGFAGTWAEELGVRLKIPAETNHFGSIKYKPEAWITVLLNKSGLVLREQTFPLNHNGQYLLTHTPVLDESYFEGNPLEGNIVLDTDSFTLTVGGVEWTRVVSLDDAEAEDEVYELDPFWGQIYFGDSGISRNGKTPVGVVIASYTQTPFISYENAFSSHKYVETDEDLDPQTLSLRQGFLVLDRKKVTPYAIFLRALAPTTGEGAGCCYGPISVPPVGPEDVLSLEAKVVGPPPLYRGIPNIPVRFNSLDGRVKFTQPVVTTNGQGIAHTEARGLAIGNMFITTNYMYTSIDGPLNPHPEGLVEEVPQWGAHLFNATTLIVPSPIVGNIEDIYLLINSIPAEGENILDYSGTPLAAEEFLTPYNPRTRTGGITVVWSKEVDGARQIVHPISATPHENPQWTLLEFEENIPTGVLITAYKTVIDRQGSVVAQTADPNLTSNTIKICLTLSSTSKGVWTLPRIAAPRNLPVMVNPPAQSNFTGSRISTAVYMQPNDLEVEDIQEEGGGDSLDFVSVGDTFDIIGTSFPTGVELKPPVFLIKEVDGEVIAVKDITDSSTVVDSTTIRITDLPTPPTEEYEVDYWIAVLGLDPQTDTGRKTAITIEVREAP